MLPVARGEFEPFVSLSNWLTDRVHSELGHFSMPSVNIRESEKEYTIEVAAPGMEKGDFNVDMHDGLLTIACERKSECESQGKEGESYLRREFNYAKFSKQFTLPDSGDEANIQANYDKGVLTVQLPKRQDDLRKQRRSIDVK